MSEFAIWREIEALKKAIDSVRAHEHGQIGTWTPTLTGSTGGGTFTYSVRTGTYTRWGRLVVAPWTIVLTAPFTSAPTGNLRVSDLPLTARNGNPNGGVIITYTDSGLSTVGRGAVVNNQAYMDFYTTAGAAVAASVVTVSTNFQGVAVYEAA